MLPFLYVNTSIIGDLTMPDVGHVVKFVYISVSAYQDLYDRGETDPNTVYFVHGDEDQYSSSLIQEDKQGG